MDGKASKKGGAKGIVVLKDSILMHLQNVLQSEDVVGNLKKMVEDIQKPPEIITISAANITLDQVKELFSLDFVREDMLSHLFGLEDASLTKAWGTSDGVKLSKETFQVPLSKWLSEGIDKVLRHTSLDSHESATRFIINLILVECLDLLQPVVSDPSIRSAEDNKDLTVDSAPTSTGSSSPFLVAVTPPPPQRLPSNALESPSVSHCSPLPSSSSPSSSSSLLATPKAAGTSETHNPLPLKLYYEQSLTALISKNHGSGPKTIRVTGIADYMLGYDTESSGIIESYAGYASHGFMVAVEAKRRGAILSAIPQCLCYMGMMAANRKTMGKINWTIYGICSSGTEFLFLRLNNKGEVIRSQIFGIGTATQKKSLLQVFFTILHAARSFSPRSSPFSNKIKILSNVSSAFGKDGNDSFVDFNIDSTDALCGFEMDIDNYVLVTPSFTPAN